MFVVYLQGPNNQGHWLVKSIQCVLDILKNADSNAEVTLEFWLHYSLFCLIELALVFRDAGVSAIASHLTRSMAVSTSFGGDFKVVLKLILYCV